MNIENTISNFITKNKKYKNIPNKDIEIEYRFYKSKK